MSPQCLLLVADQSSPSLHGIVVTDRLGIVQPLSARAHALAACAKAAAVAGRTSRRGPDSSQGEDIFDQGRRAGECGMAGGLAELVDDSVGALVAPGNPQQVTDDIAKLLLQLLQHPVDWAERGRAGRRKVEVHYSWNAKVEAAGRLYQAILNERTPA